MTRTGALVLAASLALLAGCGGAHPEPVSTMPIPRYPAPPASKDAPFAQRMAQEGLGRADYGTATAAGRGVCDDLYAGKSRDEAVELGAARHGLHPDDMRIIAGLAVEVYCPELD